MIEHGLELTGSSQSAQLEVDPDIYAYSIDLKAVSCRKGCVLGAHIGEVEKAKGEECGIGPVQEDLDVEKYAFVNAWLESYVAGTGLFVLRPTKRKEAKESVQFYCGSDVPECIVIHGHYSLLQFYLKNP